MSDLDQALDAFLEHDGVRHVLILGRDGLLIQHRGTESLDGDTVSAMLPGLASACEGVGGAAEMGGFRTAAVEMQGGVAVVASLSEDLLLALLLRPNHGFAPLLREIASRRGNLAALV